MADVRLGLDPKDYRYVVETPDPNFSPERNKAVIDETIKDAEDWYKKLYSAQDKDLENRIDILSSYARYRFNIGNKKLKEYLGETQYKAIIGERLLEKLRIAEATNKLIKTKNIKKGVLV